MGNKYTHGEKKQLVKGKRERKTLYKVIIYTNINNSLKPDKKKSMEYTVLFLNFIS